MQVKYTKALGKRLTCNAISINQYLCRTLEPSSGASHATNSGETGERPLVPEGGSATSGPLGRPFGQEKLNP